MYEGLAMPHRKRPCSLCGDPCQARLDPPKCAVCIRLSGGKRWRKAFTAEELEHLDALALLAHLGLPVTPDRRPAERHRRVGAASYRSRGPVSGAVVKGFLSPGG